MKLCLTTLLVASAAAYTPDAPSSRREMFKTLTTGVATAAFVASPSIANAIDACPSGSKNCIRTTWTPPSGSSKADVIASLRKVLESYPQEGQDKADLGGWSIVEDNFNSGSARIEYKS